MFNFFKKTKEKLAVNDTSKPVVNPTQGDFLVHNMPVAKNLSSSATNHVVYSNLNDDSSSKITGVNHQSLGLLIILGGIILVAGVIYGAYYFIIKPYTQTVVPIATPISNQAINSPVNTTAIASSSNQAISSSTPILSSTSSLFLIASSSAATNSPLISPTDLTSSTIPLISSSTASTTIQAVSSTVVTEIDTDSDGLSDAEEALLGTNPAKADTNGNGFSDLTELRNGYDPIRAGVRLSSSSAVMFYNFNNVATLVYPSTWSATEDAAKDAVVFSNGEKSFIQLSAQNNDQKALDITTWFQMEFNGLTPGGSVSGLGWKGVYSPDQLTVYLMGTKADKVYILAYSPLTDNSVSLDMFHIMIKTLTIKYK